MKIKIGVFFGGKSVEHEIAVITANQAFSNIDKEKYEIIPIYISKNGLMYTGDKLFELEEFKDMKKLINNCVQVTVVNDGKNINVIRYPSKMIGNNIINQIDVAFPIMHGTNGEDGTIQGFFELLGIPYVGCDILSSSIGMDKIAMKKILKESGIPVVEYVCFYCKEYIKEEEKYIENIENKLNYPVIVKPANLGSSVGIKKASDRLQLEEAIEYAMQFSDRIIVERAIVDLKEINCSVLGDMCECEASVCEEPISTDEILSYSDKYISGGKGKTGNQKGMANSKKKLPADLTDEMREKIEELAKNTFKVIGCNGVSRVDFLVDKITNEVFVNEINTIPGALSYYLWEATNKTFKSELDELINLALKRDRYRKELTYSYDQNILALQGSKTGIKK